MGYSPLGVTANAVWDWMFLFLSIVMAATALGSNIYIHSHLAFFPNMREVKTDTVITWHDARLMACLWSADDVGHMSRKEMERPSKMGRV